MKRNFVLMVPGPLQRIWYLDRGCLRTAAVCTAGCVLEQIMGYCLPDWLRSAYFGIPLYNSYFLFLVAAIQCSL